jgi:hypothetical protein
MALFVQKPIFWNRNSYLAPSGIVATSGFPKLKGYGHEEWNNSPRMLLKSEGRQFRVFHTEGLGAAPLAQNAGQTFVFMTASHDGVQELVGIAGNAMGLFGDADRARRLQIARDLQLNNLRDDAWAVANVRRQYQENRTLFRAEWKADLNWIANWLAPEEFFWWLDAPVTLNARTITGKGRLTTMFSSYTTWDLPTVARVMDAIPVGRRTEKWRRLFDAMQCAPSEPLPVDEQVNAHDPVTSVLTQINARRGQGQFREDLMRIWGHACAVTGIGCRELLIASHIKPWRLCTKSRDKIDAQNGLLLCANLDKLFDKGLISFEDDGQMLLSPRLSTKHRSELGVPRSLRFAPGGIGPYLKFHRERVFQR